MKCKNPFYSLFLHKSLLDSKPLMYWPKWLFTPDCRSRSRVATWAEVGNCNTGADRSSVCKSMSINLMRLHNQAGAWARVNYAT